MSGEDRKRGEDGIRKKGRNERREEGEESESKRAE